MEAVRVANQSHEAGFDSDAHDTAWAAWDAAYASALEAAATGGEAQACEFELYRFDKSPTP